MATRILLTHHHRQAMENATDRGFWMPLPLQREQRVDLMYLTCVSRGDGAIRAIAEITSLEPWSHQGAVELWLPFLGRLMPLPRPIPLGHRSRLNGWLPRHSDEVQILDLLVLLAAPRLSDLLPGPGGFCPPPRRTLTVQVAKQPDSVA